MSNTFQFSGTGPVASLEAKLREHYGKRYALCVSNATTGLLVLALALGLRKATFLTTPITWGGSLAGWLLLGNEPVFADVDPMTLTLDPQTLDQSIQPSTRAILAVDIDGSPCDDQALRRFADQHQLWYVADAAQSLGARRDGRPASAMAHALVVSFTAGKTIEAGEGGAIITDDEEIFGRLVWFSQHPMRQHREIGAENQFGLNARIHPTAATVADRRFGPSLRRLKAKQRWYLKLAAILNETGLTEKLDFAEGQIEPAFARCTAAWKNCARQAELLSYLAEHNSKGDLVSDGVSLLVDQPAFQAEYARLVPASASCPVARRQAKCRFVFAKEGDRLDQQLRRSKR
jgi:perosamine synthetase